MRRLCGGLAVAALLGAPLRAQPRPDIPQAPLAHAASKAAYSAAAYVVLREGLGLPRLPSALLSTVGVLVVAKSITYVQHPDWLQSWSPKDWTHDLAWGSLLVVPLAIGPRDHPWRAALAVGGLATGVMVTRSWSVPKW